MQAVVINADASTLSFILKVDASVMTTPTEKPRTIILRHEPQLTREAPALAPNIIHDIKYSATPRDVSEKEVCIHA